ncbi:MAG TPA: Ig-like domain-containing protein [Gemmatimonadales bacterium]
MTRHHSLRVWVRWISVMRGVALPLVVWLWAGACDSPFAPAPVAVVRVTPDTATLIAGRTRQLTATPLDESGRPLTDRKVTWAASGTAATVSATGLVTALAQGTAEIRASSDGETGSAVITVLAAVGSLAIWTYTGPPPATDANGYLVKILQVYGAMRSVWWAEANDSVTIGGLVPGSYLVTLKDLSPNCGRTSPDSLIVDVASAETSRIWFLVRCFPAATLAFTDGGSIRIINVDGSHVGYVGTDQAAEQPAWSPDGTQLVYTGQRNRNFDIFITNPDGTADARLTTDAGADWYPAWSPDGTRIAFVSNRSGTPQIFVMNADGSAANRLTTSVTADAPSWSPDGARIAFAGTDAEGIMAIYVMNADGSGDTAIDNGLAWSTYPAWSPDGTRIAFLGGAPQSPGGGYDPTVFVMDPDGTGLTRVRYGGSRPVWVSVPPLFGGPMIAVARANCELGPDEDYDSWDYEDVWCAPALLFVRPDGTFPQLLVGPSGADLAWRPGTP